MKNINESVISSNRYSQKEYSGKSTSNEKFRYDANGNTTSDLDRDIVTIRYNLLNLPEIIQFRNGSQIVNKYDAAGTKLESRFITCIVIASVPVGNVSTFQTSGLNRVYRENRTYYCGNYEYSFDGTMRTPVLSKIHNSEGYKDGRDIKNDVLHYYRRDHLGNVREVWKSGTPAQTVQRMQYYPSGLPWADCMGADYQNRKYNGKEFIEMHGYDSYDYHARHMYPALMRFTTPDPLAEKYYSISPYAYCRNNPIIRIDPDGKTDWEVVGKGALVTLGGIGSIIAGSSIAPTGIGVPATIFLVGEGIASVSFGISQMLYGAVSEPSQKTQELAQKMPTGLLDTGGIIIDEAMGNKNGEARTVAQGISLVGGVTSGTLAKDLPSVIEWGINLTTFSQAVSFVYDIQGNNTEIKGSDNSNTEHKKEITPENYVLRKEKEVKKSYDFEINNFSFNQ